MKKRIGLIASFLMLGSLLLSGCNFLFPSNTGSKETNSNTNNTLTDFDFVTDERMTIEDSDSEHPFKLLTIFVGDTYQVKTNVDGKLGDDYHFEYSGFDENIISVSSSGLVSANAKGVDSVTVSLHKNGSAKKVSSHYFIVNVKNPDEAYARITLNDSSLRYEASGRNYFLTVNGGDSYQIQTEVNFNTPYIKTFELADQAFSSFMSVSSAGLVITKRVSEDKDGKIVIKTLSQDASKVYDTVYLNIHINKGSERPPENTFEVTNLSSGAKLSDGDSLSMYVGESLSFGAKYNNGNVTNVITASNTDVLTVDGENNKITGKAAGNSDVTFAHQGKSLTVHVEVKNDVLLEIYTKNGADDLVIVNDTLHFLGKVYAKYQSGAEVDISGETSLTQNIAALDATHKRVTFGYSANGVSKTVNYDVLFFVTEDYQGDTTAYTWTDYFNNRYRNRGYILPSEGTIKMLVIPVWFNNSTSFFREDQKQEILTDLEYVFNTARGEDGFHSVKQFYEEESNGLLNFDITISDFYESGTSSKVYGDTVEADVQRVRSLTDTAIDWYFNNHSGESRSDYDLNNDGYIDAVSLVYAANYYGTIGDSNGTVAFQYKNVEGATHKYNNGSFSPIGSIYGFSKSADPSRQLACSDLSAYYPSYFFETGSRTFIHETGHMFGFIDLYEDNHAATKYYPAGKFSMQDTNFGGHDPYQMNLIGWSKPQIYDASNYEVGYSTKVHIKDFASSGNNILLTRDMNEANSLFDEYMLLELLAPTGLNAYDAKHSSYAFDDAGVRLWHINSTLEDMSENGEATNEIVSTKYVNLKYSNNDQSSEYDVAHWIRNNENEAYDTTSSVKDEYGLFMAGDHFDMATFQSQFVNGDKLDNKEKLGWEFDVDTIYQDVDGTYGAIITLNRVDNTRTDFEYSSRINKDVTTQPTGNDYELANVLLTDTDSFSLKYSFNNATPPSYYAQGKPVSYKGVCLFASPDGNGGSLVISMPPVLGLNQSIKSVSITYSMLTNASLTATVNGAEVTGTYFEGPFNSYDNYNEKGMKYEVNGNSITLQNKYSENINHFSVIAIYSIAIEYHMEQM